MTRKFTGKHMLFVMLGFFGTVIAVNLTMATLATRTFGGTVVDNSYVASQRFNGWLAEGRAQAALGWERRVALGSDRRVEAELTAGGEPLVGARVTAVASHPVGREPDIALTFEPAGNGRYRSVGRLPEGRWSLHLDVARGGKRLRAIETLR